jgi:predicted nuclease of predicted toxin-antitoxin system
LKVLFDQNVPRKLRQSLAGHDVKTAYEMNWSIEEDGSLLRKAELQGFEVLVTADTNILYQQNLRGRKIALVVLGTNNWNLLKWNIQPIISAVGNAKPGSYVELPRETWVR